MILPIRAIGDPVLKRAAKTIEENSDELQSLIDNMFETMYNAQGVGLAAPQVGVSIRVFVVDTLQTLKKGEEGEGVKDAFINPQIDTFIGEDEAFEEGCLSIPEIRENVMRPEAVAVKYLDREFQPKEMEIDGLLARVFQHEFDHLEGILFTDLVAPLKKRMLKKKLEKISKGKVQPPYPMRFPKVS